MEASPITLFSLLNKLNRLIFATLASSPTVIRMRATTLFVYLYVCVCVRFFFFVCVCTHMRLLLVLLDEPEKFKRKKRTQRRTFTLASKMLRVPLKKKKERNRITGHVTHIVIVGRIRTTMFFFFRVSVCVCVCAAGLLSRSKTLQVSDSTRMSPHLRLPNSTHLYICMMLLDTFLCHVVTLLFLLALIFLLTISQNHLLFFFFLPFNDNYFFFFFHLCVCVSVCFGLPPFSLSAGAFDDATFAVEGNNYIHACFLSLPPSLPPPLLSKA